MSADTIDAAEAALRAVIDEETFGQPRSSEARLLLALDVLLAAFRAALAHESERARAEAVAHALNFARAMAKELDRAGEAVRAREWLDFVSELEGGYTKDALARIRDEARKEGFSEGWRGATQSQLNADALTGVRDEAVAELARVRVDFDRECVNVQSLSLELSAAQRRIRQLEGANDINYAAAQKRTAELGEAQSECDRLRVRAEAAEARVAELEADHA